MSKFRAGKLKKINFTVILLSQLLNLFGIAILLPIINNSLNELIYQDLILDIVILQSIICFNPVSNVWLRGLIASDINVKNIEGFLGFIFIFAFTPLIFLWFLSAQCNFGYSDFIFYVILLLSAFIVFLERAFLTNKDLVGLAVFKVSMLQVLPLIMISIWSNFLEIKTYYVISSTIVMLSSFIFVRRVEIIDAMEMCKYFSSNCKGELIFSITSLMQSNVDKYIIPFMFDKSVLASYYLAVMIPSRIVAIYSNVSNIYSKLIFKTLDLAIVNAYLKKCIVIYLVVALLLFYYADYIVLDYLSLDSDYLLFYNLSIFISLIQVFGFINYQFFSALNKIGTYTAINVVSTVLFLLTAQVLNSLSLGLVAVSLSLFISKLSEPVGTLIVRYEVRKNKNEK